MLLRDFPDILMAHFGKDAVDASSFLDPLRNFKDKDIQYLYSDGAIIPPWNTKATSFFFARPGEGPFYSRELLGIVHSYSKGAPKYHWLKAVSENADKVLELSSAIPIETNCQGIKDFVTQLGITWYRVDRKTGKLNGTVCPPPYNYEKDILQSNR